MNNVIGTASSLIRCLKFITPVPWVSLTCTFYPQSTPPLRPPGDWVHVVIAQNIGHIGHVSIVIVAYWIADCAHIVSTRMSKIGAMLQVTYTFSDNLMCCDLREGTELAIGTYRALVHRKLTKCSICENWVFLAGEMRRLANQCRTCSVWRYLSPYFVRPKSSSFVVGCEPCIFIARALSLFLEMIIPYRK